MNVNVNAGGARCGHWVRHPRNLRCQGGSQEGDLTAVSVAIVLLVKCFCANGGSS